MSDSPMSPQQMYIYGGTGGAGGGGGGQGGNGGAGQGPRVYVTGDNNTIYSAGETEEQERMKVLEWISPLNFLVRHQEITATREKTTGEWLLQQPDFVKWKSGSGNMLWCSGIPGMGKTVLVSKVIDHFQQAQFKDSSIGIAGVYLNYKEMSVQTIENLLGAIWKQLVKSQDIEAAKALYDAHRDQKTRASIAEIQMLLSPLIEKFKTLYIIVDALDEYPADKRDVLVDHLMQLGKNVNVLITCRPNVSPPPGIKSLSTLELQASEQDIRNYIITSLQGHKRLSGFMSKDASLQKQILTKIIAKAHGM
ncbi:NACHT and ankyrin domain protein [Mycena indigotica]|uniref:NACHT and ankyrin domain protein n=1 Tax=Mycena indigotica TaxID=2126181 RepID=A0A8H6VT43_9AGAR|nr:NACHT and ankyrin domain protein [Mycena indigotica]KAF7292997.1 NACHT and ankyrin domain protein [Mycena indigotica]